jgi:nicotinamidase-related amidase
MPAERDLHGSAPDNSPVALLLIDVINDLDFPEADQLLEHALPAARRIAELKRRARAAGVPVVYVNDNFGRWRSDLAALVEHASRPEAKGRPIAELLRPDRDDYFVVKPKHSGFFRTALEILLDHLGTRTVVLAGFAGNICVLFTANDAYMRDLRVAVPADCVASNTAADNRYALEQVANLLKADTRPAAEVDFAALAEAARGSD